MSLALQLSLFCIPELISTSDIWNCALVLIIIFPIPTRGQDNSREDVQPKGRTRKKKKNVKIFFFRRGGVRSMCLELTRRTVGRRPKDLQDGRFEFWIREYQLDLDCLSQNILIHKLRMRKRAHQSP